MTSPRCRPDRRNFRRKLRNSYGDPKPEHQLGPDGKDVGGLTSPPDMELVAAMFVPSRYRQTRAMRTRTKSVALRTSWAGRHCPKRTIVATKRTVITL